MARWRLTTPIQKGCLDEVNEFLPGLENLVGCEIIVPITQDLKIAINHISGWASNTLRVFEITWSKPENKLAIWAIASENDIENFKTSIKLSYPNCDFGSNTKNITPSWFDMNNSENYQIFDVSTRHGHPFILFNTTKQMTLISKICSVIQRSDRTWIQFVFQNRDFNTIFNKLSTRIQNLERTVTKPVIYYTEIGGQKTRLQRPHEELNSDFGSNVKGIKRHLTERMTGQHIMMSVRGIVESSDSIDIDSTFSVIDAMPFENLASSFDHLQKYTYSTKRFYDPKNPKNVRTLTRLNNDKNLTMPKLEALFVRRLLPNPTKFLSKFLGEYCSNKLWASFIGMKLYHKRRPLPFLILGHELAIILHLPDPNIIPGVHSTRGQIVPKSYHEKIGFLMGEYI